MDNSVGLKLIDKLLVNPSEFYNSGESYQLLQEYFNGFSLETLKPLLCHESLFVRRNAIWITSELGINGAFLIDEAIALLKDDDRNIRHYALGVVAVCSVGENMHEYINVFSFLECEDEDLCNSAMFLISNANYFQLKECVRLYGKKEHFNKLHYEGLTILLRIHEGLTNLLEYDVAEQTEFMLYSDSQMELLICSDVPLMKKYGIIIAKKMFVSCNSCIIPILKKICFR